MAKVAQNNQQSDTSSQDVTTLTRVARKAGTENARSAEQADTGQERESARSASESKAANGSTVLDLFAEQARHSIETTAAIGRAKSLTEVMQVQTDFLGRSFERFGQMNERYLSVIRSGAKRAPFYSTR